MLRRPATPEETNRAIARLIYTIKDDYADDMSVYDGATQTRIRYDADWDLEAGEHVELRYYHKQATGEYTYLNYRDIRGKKLGSFCVHLGHKPDPNLRVQEVMADGNMYDIALCRDAALAARKRNYVYETLHAGLQTLEAPRADIRADEAWKFADIALNLAVDSRDMSLRALALVPSSQLQQRGIDALVRSLQTNTSSESNPAHWLLDSTHLRYKITERLYGRSVDCE